MEAMHQELTDAQRSAVIHVDGPLLILAGPGSGKTRVVTHRVANMLHGGIPSWQIAALTFTNKAADEMRERVEKLVPGQHVWMGTFHRFCAQLLRRYAGMVGLKENYSIYDTSDSKTAIKRAVESSGFATSHTSPEKIASLISRAKNRLITPEQMQGQVFSPEDQIASQVYPVYQQQLLTANAVDFDDLLMHVAVLLRESPEVRRELDARFRYIMVDEYQDTNLAQYAIVRALSIDNPNLAVTGDPDQSIYGWRGADIKNILDFEQDYPDVKTVRLEQNYRSTPNILRVADQLIRHNRRRKHKALFTDNIEGEAVTLRMYQSGYDEADGIADEIAHSMAAHGLKASDYAVFCRMNALTRSLEHSLRNRGIPYQVVNGLAFYQRKEIKDLLAYLNLINNPSNDVALMRVINTPTRGIGAKTISRLQQHADQYGISMLESASRVEEITSIAKRSATMVKNFVRLFEHLQSKATASLEDLLLFLIEETKFAAYLDKSSVESNDSDPMANVDELVTAAVEFDRRHPESGGLEAFLEQVSLVSDTDALEAETERVKLMTMHAAKGLEFPRVFVIGVEDDLIPHKRSKDTESQFEEERRLLFVAITRAKEWLQLSCCKSRSIRGDFRPVVPSPFLNELPLEEMKKIESATERDWFDDSDEEGDYPESWDLVQESPEDEFEKSAEPGSLNELPAYEPPKKAKPKKKVSIASLKTGADMLGSDAVPVNAYREGMIVRHDEYGSGTIISVTGRGPKRTAKVLFADGEHQFRLAYAKLKILEAGQG